MIDEDAVAREAGSRRGEPAPVGTGQTDATIADPARAEPSPPEHRGWPRVAASTAVFRGDEVLLVERGKASSRGLWSLPGGHIEAGETAAAAAEREVREETGVDVHMGGIVGVHDVIVRDGAGQLTAHYVLTVHWARWRSGEPSAASDVIGARFVPLSAIGTLPTTAGLETIVQTAAALCDRGRTRTPRACCPGRSRIVLRAVPQHHDRAGEARSAPRRRARR